MPPSLLPIVLVSGFLGAGKTTLMRRLIVSAREGGLRAGVIVNEFGQNDVDSHILREADAELLASIAGGCACCTGQDDLLQTLLEIAARPAHEKPDVILMESSGLADPVLLLDVLTAAPLLPHIRIAAIVCVVDAAQPDEIKGSLGPLLRRQAEAADWLVLNKIDLVAPAQLAGLERALQQLNAQAGIVRTTQCHLDFARLWQQTLQTPHQSTLKSAHQSTLNEAAPHSHAHTLVVPLPHPVERAALEAAFAQLPPHVWRAKGWAQVRGEGLRLIQYTGGAPGRLHIAPFALPHGALEPDTFLVFIGATLVRKQIENVFNQSTLSAFW